MASSSSNQPSGTTLETAKCKPSPTAPARTHLTALLLDHVPILDPQKGLVSNNFFSQPGTFPIYRHSILLNSSPPPPLPSAILTHLQDNKATRIRFEISAKTSRGPPRSLTQYVLKAQAFCIDKDYARIAGRDFESDILWAQFKKPFSVAGSMMQPAGVKEEADWRWEDLREILRKARLVQFKQEAVERGSSGEQGQLAVAARVGEVIRGWVLVCRGERDAIRS